MIGKCYSVSRSSLDKNNDIVSKCWIVCRHGHVAKITSAAVFTAAEDLAIPYTLAKILTIHGDLTPSLRGRENVLRTKF